MFANSITFGFEAWWSLTVCRFDAIESAKRAKQSLNGADIYSGCCTLKIEYAKVTQVFHALLLFSSDITKYDSY